MTNKNGDDGGDNNADDNDNSYVHGRSNGNDNENRNNILNSDLHQRSAIIPGSRVYMEEKPDHSKVTALGRSPSKSTSHVFKEFPMLSRKDFKRKIPTSESTPEAGGFEYSRVSKRLRIRRTPRQVYDEEEVKEEIPRPPPQALIRRVTISPAVTMTYLINSNVLYLPDKCPRCSVTSATNTLNPQRKNIISYYNFCSWLGKRRDERKKHCNFNFNSINETFFCNSNSTRRDGLTVDKILTLGFEFLYPCLVSKRTSHKGMMNIPLIKTNPEFRTYYKQLVIEDLEETPRERTPIAGAGFDVQIGLAFGGHGKFHLLRQENGLSLLFVGICLQTEEYFVVSVESVSSDTLKRCIQGNISAESKIYTGAYGKVFDFLEEDEDMKSYTCIKSDSLGGEDIALEIWRHCNSKDLWRALMRALEFVRYEQSPDQIMKAHEDLYCSIGIRRAFHDKNESTHKKGRNIAEKEINSNMMGASNIDAGLGFSVQRKDKKMHRQSPLPAKNSTSVFRKDVENVSTCPNLSFKEEVEYENSLKLGEGEEYRFKYSVSAPNFKCTTKAIRAEQKTTLKSSISQKKENKAVKEIKTEEEKNFSIIFNNNDHLKKGALYPLFNTHFLSNLLMPSQHISGILPLEYILHLTQCCRTFHFPNLKAVERKTRRITRMDSARYVMYGDNGYGDWTVERPWKCSPLAVAVLELVLSEIAKETGLSATANCEHFKAKIGFAITLHDENQYPHLDWQGLELIEDEKVYPWILHLPLTENGMYLRVWGGKRNSKAQREIPTMVHIPFGTFLVLRADVIHAGVYGGRGNIRLHAQLSRDWKSESMQYGLEMIKGPDGTDLTTLDEVNCKIIHSASERDEAVCVLNSGDSNKLTKSFQKTFVQYKDLIEPLR